MGTGMTLKELEVPASVQTVVVAAYHQMFLLHFALTHPLLFHREKWHVVTAMTGELNDTRSCSVHYTTT